MGPPYLTVNTLAVDASPHSLLHSISETSRLYGLDVTEQLSSLLG